MHEPEKDIVASVDTLLEESANMMESVNSTEFAEIMRILVLEMIQFSASGHIGSSLSCVDIISVLKFQEMQWSAEIDRNESDVFILSKGHAVPTWYAALIAAGEAEEKLKYQLRQIDSPFQGHPDRSRCEWIDASTGALGQGLSIAIGRAIAKKLKSQNSYIYCIVGDGECQEGQIWEALMYAGFQKINNVILFIDHNKKQSDGDVAEVLSLSPLVEKLTAFNWHVQEIDGHSHQQIQESVISAKAHLDGPSVIVANTTKGYIGEELSILKGAHSGILSDDEFSDVLNVLRSKK